MGSTSSIDRRRAVLAAVVGPDGLWSELAHGNQSFPVVSRGFWTSRQRQACNLHEISYRACYKPQLPRFFIERLTSPGEPVYDPFGGRGTTALEAALLGRRVVSNDINPLSQMLAQPRLTPPSPNDVQRRLADVPRSNNEDCDLGMFFHPNTEGELRAMRQWFAQRRESGELDQLDAWVRMVATNRLTGHSPGFFSAYTLPPNQAVTREKQIELNQKRGQSPEYRDTHSLVVKKSRQLTRGLSSAELEGLRGASKSARFLTCDARDTHDIKPNSISLTVTSPPFLDVIQYEKDNWLRCWFCGLDAKSIGKRITMAHTLDAWADFIGGVLNELHRITKPGGHVAFEVGEVKKGTVRLEETILPLGLNSGFEPLGVLINTQTFTKTANIWGVSNNAGGTNTNRIVLFRKA